MKQYHLYSFKPLTHQKEYKFSARLCDIKAYLISELKHWNQDSINLNSFIDLIWKTRSIKKINDIVNCLFQSFGLRVEREITLA